jgi:hypothetical protein
MDDAQFEHVTRIDRIARTLAGETSRRRALVRLGGIAAGSLLPLTRSTGASANHTSKHCAKDGKRCHKHKECCGLCGSNGYCQSCAGVVTWVDRNLSRLTEAERYAEDARLAIREVPIGHPVNLEILAPVADASDAIGRFSTEISTEVTPPPADDPLRTMLEIFAAMAETLEEYLEKVADEAYIETGEGAGIALTAIDTFVAGIMSVEVEIAVLRDACDD